MKPPASARVGPAVLKDARMGLLVAAATDRASQGMTEGMVGGNRKGHTEKQGEVKLDSPETFGSRAESDMRPTPLSMR